MRTVGPTKLILINSGKYDYAEIDLDCSIHLVGPNNVGKTSLIATLQFLYIDEPSEMHFSRPLNETRRYYFPERTSYVLVECLTPTGFAVVGVQGSGPLRGYEFERFTYRGRFDRRDFVEDNGRLRPPDDARASLATRSLAVLQAADFRQALTGSIESGADVPSLEIVPLRARDLYSRFRSNFNNLLRLSGLTQNGLKKQLVQAFAPDFRVTRIDVASSYSDLFDQVQRSVDDIAHLEAIRDVANDILDSSAKREELRMQLLSLFAAIQVVGARERERQCASRVQNDAATAANRERHCKLDGEYTDNEQTMRAADKEHALMQAKVNEHDQLTRDLDGFDPVRARERASVLDAEILALAVKSQSTETSTTIEKRLQRQSEDLQRLRARMQDVSKLAFQRVRRHLDLAQISTAFRLLNPELLAINETDLRVRSEKKFGETLKSIANAVSDGVFRGAGVEVDLASVAPVDLGAYEDPDEIADLMAPLESRIAADTSLLAFLRDRTAQEAKLSDLRAEAEELRTQLARHERMISEMARIAEWRTQAALAREDGDRAASRLRGIGDERAALDDEWHGLKEERKRIETDAAQLTRWLADLAPVNADWGVAVPVQEDTRDIATLISCYVNACSSEKDLNAKIASGLRQVDRATNGRISSHDSPDTIKQLADVMAALPQRQKAIEELWGGLVTGMGAACKGLLADVETLRARVAELNRRLRRVSVSNLQEVTVILNEQTDELTKLRHFIATKEEPLFTPRGIRETAIDEFKEFIKKQRNRPIELASLFDLSFEVVGPSGKRERYHSLDVESTGTTVTIKVVVNLMLLHSLLQPDKQVSIPFYLDEASNLDRANLRSILGFARGLGFTPVLASPHVVDAAEKIYFVRERGGRVTIRPKQGHLHMLDNGIVNPEPADEARQPS
jgi:hypothetical protein